MKKENIESNFINILIKDLNGNKYIMNVNSSMKIYSLKYLISNQINIPIENYTLFFDGKKYNENNTLESCYITKDTIIQISQRMSSFF